jgi:AraC family transcriptional regulator
MSELEQNIEIREFLRGPSTRLLSTAGRGWPGLALEHHLAPPGERAEASLSGLILFLWLGPSVGTGERFNSKGSFSPYVNSPGTLTVHGPGAIPPVRPFSVSNLLMCAMDMELIEDVGEEMKADGDLQSSVAAGSIAEYKPAFTDDAIRQMLRLLANEARSRDSSGLVYVQSLGQALVSRLFKMTYSRPGMRPTPALPLPARALRSIVDKIEANPSLQFNLNELATEIGYSKGHFLRSFRARTGLTPHQYILRARLDRAKELMAVSSLTLLEIALECGFTSHGHFSRTFRQHCGQTPSEFRRSKLSSRFLEPVL